MPAKLETLSDADYRRKVAAWMARVRPALSDLPLVDQAVVLEALLAEWLTRRVSEHGGTEDDLIAGIELVHGAITAEAAYRWQTRDGEALH